MGKTIVNERPLTTIMMNENIAKGTKRSPQTKNFRFSLS